MTNGVLQAESASGGPAFPLTLPLALALAVWTLGLLQWPGERQPQPLGQQITSGTATELGARIRAAPRAVVFVGCPACVQATRARNFFPDAAAQIATVRPDVAFFVIENESAEDSRAWAAVFGHHELHLFGHLGNGWVLWLENGQLRDNDPYSGVAGRTSQGIVDRTLAVWP